MSRTLVLDDDYDDSSRSVADKQPPSPLNKEVDANEFFDDSTQVTGGKKRPVRRKAQRKVSRKVSRKKAKSRRRSRR